MGTVWVMFVFLNLFPMSKHAVLRESRGQFKIDIRMSVRWSVFPSDVRKKERKKERKERRKEKIRQKIDQGRKKARHN